MARRVRFLRIAVIFAALALAPGAAGALENAAPNPANGPAMPPVSQETLDLLRSEARAYEHGEGVPKDVERAVSLYCDGARYGDAESQYSLGWMYANGRGVERNDDLAASFFQMAARQGHEPSQKMLRYVGEEPAALPECMTAKAPVDDGGGAFDENSPLQQYIYALVRQLAPEYGLSPRLVMAIIRTESNFEPGAISPKNAQGLMQLIPPTSARFNVRRPFDPEQNIRGGMAYLRWLLAYFEGDVSLVAAAYNAGEGAVNRYRGVPPYTETRVYVARILRLYEKVDHPFDPQIAAPSPEMPRIRRAMGGQFLRTGIQ